MKYRLGSTVAGLAFLYAAANADRPDAQVGAVFIALGLMLGMIVLITRRASGAVKAEGSGTGGAVAICARPILAVPSIHDAYAALPAHCHAVLGR